MYTLYINVQIEQTMMKFTMCVWYIYIYILSHVQYIYIYSSIYTCDSGNVYMVFLLLLRGLLGISVIVEEFVQATIDVAVTNYHPLLKQLMLK